MIEITPRIAIDEAELEERFFRAGGPGGQNVKAYSGARPNGRAVSLPGRWNGTKSDMPSSRQSRSPTS